MNRRDRLWLQAVLEEYESKLLRYAADLVGPALAQDVVQDTFLKLAKQGRGEIEHLGPWLYRVCRNQALDLRRKVTRLRPLEDDDAASLRDGAAGPAEHLERSQTRDSVRRAMGELSDLDRELVRLKFDGSMSYRQIAELTGLSVSNVGYRLHHAIRQVREAMQSAQRAQLASAREGGSR